MRWGSIAAFGAAFVLLAAGCGGSETAGAGAAGIVPAGVPAFIALDTNPDSSQWQTVDELASKFPDKQKAIKGIKDSLSDDGVDWDKDIKPALGDEADFVWLDFENDGENFVVLMQPRDEGAFERAVEKGNAREENPSDRLRYEKFRGWMVMSDKQALIDRFKRMSDSADEALDADPTFTKAIGTTPDEALARVYVDGRKVMDEINVRTDAEEKKFVRQIGSLDWIAAALAAESDGVAVDTTVHGTPGSLFAKNQKGTFPSYEAKLPSRIPQNAVLYYTFHGTKGLLGGLENNPTFDTPGLRPFMSVLKELGTLLEGEDAFYVRPPANGQLPEVTLVASPKPGVSGRATLDRIMNKFSSDIGVRPRHGTVAGVPASTLAFGDAFSIHYADVGGKLVVTDLPAGITGVKSPGKTLSDNGTFKDAVERSGMPKKTNGFVFVDIRAGTGLAEKLSGMQLPADVSRNLRPLRSAVEYVASKQHQLSIKVFLRIQ